MDEDGTEEPLEGVPEDMTDEEGWNLNRNASPKKKRQEKRKWQEKAKDVSEGFGRSLARPQ